MFLDVIDVYRRFVVIVRRECVVIVAELANQIVVVMEIVARVEQVSTEVQMVGLVINVKNGIVRIADIIPSVKNAKWNKMIRCKE